MKTHIVKRPWGQFEQFTQNEATSVKIHTVNPGGKSSLQSHAKREEFWRILSGSGKVFIAGEEHSAKPGDEYSIPVGVRHRWAGGAQGMALLEICFGDFDENDITRTEDDYGRV